MEQLSNILSVSFGVLLAPFASMSPLWGLTSVSIVSGLVLVWLYGKISNQKALAGIKRSISAGVLESVLFRHDVRLSLRGQLAMLLGGVRYFLAAVPPILILLAPCLLLMAHLNSRYGYRPLQAGESAIVSLDVADDDALFTAELRPPAGVAVTPPLRDLDTRTVSWRIDLPREAVTNHPPLEIAIGDSTARFSLATGDDRSPIASEVYRSPWWRLLYPSAGIPAPLSNYAQRLAISYPERELPFPGFPMSWLVAFAIISIGTGLIGSKIFGIEV